MVSRIPPARIAVLDANNNLTLAWRRYLQSLEDGASTTSADLTAVWSAIAALQLAVAALEAEGANDPLPYAVAFRGNQGSQTVDVYDQGDLVSRSRGLDFVGSQVNTDGGSVATITIPPDAFDAFDIGGGDFLDIQAGAILLYQ